MGACTVLVARQGMENKDGVGFGGVKGAVCLVGQFEFSQRSAAIKLERFVAKARDLALRMPFVGCLELRGWHGLSRLIVAALRTLINLTTPWCG